ncbi:hypothetical protein E2C01_058204 [Portunus trituberculatus]|uniref:Uncharacterized protein n=1 Tax=Portunus trituberculatus TaxID=210409 RepID=A0A5B7H205_PORTR|nr:hypothetical protein [Portunus trituberculatus]
MMGGYELLGRQWFTRLVEEWKGAAVRLCPVNHPVLSTISFIIDLLDQTSPLHFHGDDATLHFSTSFRRYLTLKLLELELLEGKVPRHQALHSR